MSSNIRLLSLIVLTLCTAAVALWLWAPIYGATNNIATGVDILYSNNDTFIFIGHETSILSGTRFKLFVDRLTQAMQWPERISEDMLVIHVKDGRISKFDMKGFGFGGCPLVYRANVYWMRGGDPNRNGAASLWRWTGSDFVQVSDRTEGIDMKSSWNSDELIEKEGWREHSFLLRGRRTEATLHQDDGDTKLFARVKDLQGGNDRAQVLMELPKRESAEVLIDVIEGYRQISKDEYLKLKSHKSASPGH